MGCDTSHRLAYLVACARSGDRVWEVRGHELYLPNWRMAVLQLVMAVVSVFLIGFVIDALAPTFGAQKNMAQAVKVAAYAYTPVWIVGVLAALLGVTLFFWFLTENGNLTPTTSLAGTTQVVARVLEDDREYFPKYNVSLVLRQEVDQQFHAVREHRRRVRGRSRPAARHRRRGIERHVGVGDRWHAGVDDFIAGAHDFATRATRAGRNVPSLEQRFHGAPLCK